MDVEVSIRSKNDASVRETTCAIEDGLVVGRGAEQGILLDGPDLSREHFTLTAEGNHFYITDLSSNGTWLNGAKLKHSLRTQVQPGDSIEVPGYCLTFKLVGLAEKTDETMQVAEPPSPIHPRQNASSPLELTPPPGIFAPVFRFVGSFTFLEKFLILVGAAGLLLLATYLNS